MRRSKNPSSPQPSFLEKYLKDNYVGTVIAPKSMIPLAIFAHKNKEAFRLFSPNMKYTVGSGYFGGEEHECTRQHMQPGLDNHKDRGLGFGAALYIAGNIVVSAAHDKQEDFPFYLHGEICTSSSPLNRSKDADVMWHNLVRHGLAKEKTDFDEEEFDERIDPDLISDLTDHIDSYLAEGMYQGYDVSVQGFRGYLDAYGTRSREITYNTLDWYDVLESGLILHLSTKYILDWDSKSRPYIPPGVFAALDWRETSLTGEDGLPGIAEYAWQNIQLVKEHGESSEDWLLEMAESWDGPVGDHLLELLEQDVISLSANPRKRRKKSRSKFHAVDDRWMRMWGPSAFTKTIGNPVLEQVSFKQNIPGKRWLTEKLRDARDGGMNRWGVPRTFGPVTGTFSQPLWLPTSLLSPLRGERGEQDAPRQRSLDYLLENWDTARLNPVYIEVDPFGQPWVSEGNHRIMVAAALDEPSVLAEVKYFSGSQLRVPPEWAPEQLLQYHQGR